MALLALLLIPLLTAMVLLVATPTRYARGIALFSSLVSLALTLWLWSNYQGIPVQALDVEWATAWGLRFTLGYDGVGLLMLLLTALVYPFIIGAGYGERLQHPSMINALLLFTQSFVMGVFTAQNLLLFYIFYELALLPVFFLLLYWGGERRRAITVRFFMYTLLGGLSLLFGAVYCLVQVEGFNGDLSALATLDLPYDTQVWLFWVLFLAFAIKLPIFPFHGWQPDTYTTAPVQGTMVLSAVMLKMGLYGTMRIVFPAVPLGVEHWRDTVIVLSLVGAIYAAIIAFRQSDLRRLIAYSSLSHVGVLCAGLFTCNRLGMTGSLYQAFAHAVLAIGMLYISGALKERVGSSEMAAMGGLKARVPRLAVLFMLVLVNAIGLPFTQSFVGEWLMFAGLWQVNAWLSLAAVSTIVLGAIYMLYAYQRVMLGTDKWAIEMNDVSLRDHLVLVPLVTLTFVLGVHPRPILDLVEGPVQVLLTSFPTLN
jgi:NADH-quinone oxidoreductase subunit M